MKKYRLNSKYETNFKDFLFFSTALTTLSFLLEKTEFKHIELTRDIMMDKKYFDTSLKEYYDSLDSKNILQINEILG